MKVGDKIRLKKCYRHSQIYRTTNENMIVGMVISLRRVPEGGNDISIRVLKHVDSIIEGEEYNVKSKYFEKINHNKDFETFNERKNYENS